MFRSTFGATLGLMLLLGAAHRLPAQDIVDTAVQAGQFNTLVAAVKAAGLVETLKGDGPFTVFAPTDEAFSKLPEGTVDSLLKEENRDQLIAILTYHVVPGRVSAKTAYGLSSATTVNGQRLEISQGPEGLKVDEASVIQTDIACSNGVIHVIDQVVMPSLKTIPEIAAEAGTFQTLLTAVKTAGLAEVLSGKGPFTVFAPTDEAFAKLPEGTVESLLQEENRDQLVAILKYHVVAGRVYSDDVLKVDSAKTLQGQVVVPRVDAQGVLINDSRVVSADIEASNGVIHVIDAVLLPPEKSAADAQKILEAAVAKGAPMYNHGDHRGCCRVYQQACESLMEMPETLPGEAVTRLKTAMRQAEHEHHMGRRAWIYRHAMDEVYRMTR